MREDRLTVRLAPSRSRSGCLWVACSCLIFSPAALPAQSLHLLSAPASPGMDVPVNLSLKSPPGKEPPSALQWEATIPIRLMTLPDENTAPGPQAQAAGKALS